MCKVLGNNGFEEVQYQNVWAPACASDIEKHSRGHQHLFELIINDAYCGRAYKRGGWGTLHNIILVPVCFAAWGG